MGHQRHRIRVRHSKFLKLDEKGIPLITAYLVWEAALSPTNYRGGAYTINCHARRPILRARAELAGPDHISSTVILNYKGIRISIAGLTWQDAVGMACHITITATIDCHAIRPIPRPNTAAKLPGPYNHPL